MGGFRLGTPLRGVATHARANRERGGPEVGGSHPAVPAGLWSFLWFVGFCFLTNQWQRTAPGPGPTQAGDAARSAIAFSFFSILSWVSAPGAQGWGWGTRIMLAGPA